MWRSCGGVASKTHTKFRYFVGEERSEAVSKLDTVGVSLADSLGQRKERAKKKRRFAVE